MTTTPHGRAVTLADIAASTHTTVPTVSKVLGGRTDVSAATRERVLAAAAAAGYRRTPRGSSRGRPADDGGLIDLVLSGVEGSWANHALSGVGHAAASAGLDVVVTVADPDGRADWLTRLIARRSRGAVLALLAPTATQLGSLRAAGIPVVLLDPTAEAPVDTPSVGATNWAGGHAAGRHLLELGHRDLAVVGGRREHVYSVARIDGFRSALAAQSVPLLEGDVQYGDWRRTEAGIAAGRLLDRTHPPTAVFACSDRMAMGVYDAARARGIRIPGQLGVIGFDDLPEASWVSPPLSTVRQPVSEMAAAALRLLLRLTSGTTDAVTHEELATTLVARESTGPPTP